MDGFQDAKRLDGNSTGNSLFDASQYAFFGHDVVEEVELGGLEDEEDIPAVGIEDEYQVDLEEGDCLGASFSDVDDLASTFSKLNKAVSGQRSAGFIGDRGSRESSSAAEWVQEDDYSNFYNQQLYHPEDLPQEKRWSSQPYSLGQLAESKQLHRTSSYPDPQPQLLPQHHQNFSSEPIPVPKSSFPSYPPVGRPHMVSANHHAQHPNNQFLPGGPQMALHSQNSLSGPLAGLPHGPQFAANLPQFSPPGHSVDGRQPSQWSNRDNLLNNLMQQRLPHQNGLMPPQLMAQQQQHYGLKLNHQVHPPRPHLGGMPSQLHGPHMAQSPPMLNKFDAMMGFPDMRDQRLRLSQKNRPNLRYFQQGYDVNNQRGDGGWPLFRSKYMTAEEIENILRIQLVATHSNDPYVDDYYHQACLAKKSSGARLKHNFCPTQLRDLPARARPTDEPHPFLQVEALGRIPFSSIRRPKPLLEVDPPSSTSSGSSEQKIIDKPLEQEPMLAARVTIEDCLCLLLDIDDIDRFLQFNQFPDGGTELRQRRQSLLEELAASLQLVDPLGKGGQNPKDDLVFVRILSLPKGRKLLGKYLQPLLPGSELLRIVCMAIFRHLRFLFGTLPSDLTAVEAITNLVKILSSCVDGMDLNGLSACLAAVVCSPEPPPLRPIGSAVGDGASVVIKSVLDRATEILRDPSAASNYRMPNPAFWQASFDEFFKLLLKYCYNKYESIVQPLHMQASPDIGSDVARAIKREMPVELLRASLPHTNDHQRKLLLDLAQRSVPIVGPGGHGGNGNLDG